jgi:hypothetical protein
MQMIDCGDGTPGTALLYLEAAIRIMDSCSVPPEIGAHADLAKERLEDWISGLAVPGTAAEFSVSTRQDFMGH